MTYREERHILDSIRDIRKEVHQNNLMLSDICKTINVYLVNHQKENEDDFGRNVLANLLSSGIDIARYRGK